MCWIPETHTLYVDYISTKKIESITPCSLKKKKNRLRNITEIPLAMYPKSFAQNLKPLFFPSLVTLSKVVKQDLIIMKQYIYILFL